MANPWLAHVKKTMKDNRGVSFKQVLRIAKKSYKKISSGKGPAAFSRKRRGTRRGKQYGGGGHGVADFAAPV